MIHQLTFATPKPGMTEADFQHYWLNVHAVRYAMKIPQIRRYAVDTTITPPGEAPPPWRGVAEIWLENEEEQLASLHSPEYLEGARRDEPRWAAFWRTVALDTHAEILLPGEPQRSDEREVKLIVLAKRAEGLSVADFRRHGREVHGPLVLGVPEVSRYYQCYVRDACYELAEPPFDAAFQIWFSAPLDGSPEYAKVLADYDNFVNPRYRHELLVRQNWIIGPEGRS